MHILTANRNVAVTTALRIARSQLAGSIPENETHYATGRLTACFIAETQLLQPELHGCGIGNCLEAIPTAAILKVSLITV
jgi:hypothetical protein